MDTFESQISKIDNLYSKINDEKVINTSYIDFNFKTYTFQNISNFQSYYLDPQFKVVPIKDFDIEDYKDINIGILFLYTIHTSNFCPPNISFPESVQKFGFIIGEGSSGESLIEFNYFENNNNTNYETVLFDPPDKFDYYNSNSEEIAKRNEALRKTEILWNFIQRFNQDSNIWFLNYIPPSFDKLKNQICYKNQKLMLSDCKYSNYFDHGSYKLCFSEDAKGWMSCKLENNIQDKDPSNWSDEQKQSTKCEINLEGVNICREGEVCYKIDFISPNKFIQNLYGIPPSKSCLSIPNISLDEKQTIFQYLEHYLEIHIFVGIGAIAIVFLYNNSFDKKKISPISKFRVTPYTRIKLNFIKAKL